MATELPEDDDSVLAGEYALRLLDPASERAFETRLAADPALRRRVAEWQESLAALADQVPEVPPPPGLQAALESRLFPARPAAAQGWSIGRLLGGSLVGAALIFALVLVLPFALNPPPPPGPVYTAEIATEAGVAVDARLDTATGTLRVTRTAGAPAPGRSLELWLIADGASAPISLGVIDDTQTDIAVPGRLSAAFVGGQLAISDEPEGGSPTGTPTNVLGAAPIQLV